MLMVELMWWVLTALFFHLAAGFKISLIKMKCWGQVTSLRIKEEGFQGFIIH